MSESKGSEATASQPTMSLSPIDAAIRAFIPLQYTNDTASARSELPKDMALLLPSLLPKLIEPVISTDTMNSLRVIFSKLLVSKSVDEAVLFANFAIHVLLNNDLEIAAGILAEGMAFSDDPRFPELCMMLITQFVKNRDDFREAYEKAKINKPEQVALVPMFGILMRADDILPLVKKAEEHACRFLCVLLHRNDDHADGLRYAIQAIESKYAGFQTLGDVKPLQHNLKVLTEQGKDKMPRVSLYEEESLHSMKPLGNWRAVTHTTSISSILKTMEETAVMCEKSETLGDFAPPLLHIHDKFQALRQEKVAPVPRVVQKKQDLANADVDMDIVHAYLSCGTHEMTPCEKDLCAVFDELLAGRTPGISSESRIHAFLRFLPLEILLQYMIISQNHETIQNRQQAVLAICNAVIDDKRHFHAVALAAGNIFFDYASALTDLSAHCKPLAQFPKAVRDKVDPKNMKTTLPKTSEEYVSAQARSYLRLSMEYLNYAFQAGNTQAAVLLSNLMLHSNIDQAVVNIPTILGKALVAAKYVGDRHHIYTAITYILYNDLSSRLGENDNDDGAETMDSLLTMGTTKAAARKQDKGKQASR